MSLVHVYTSITLLDPKLHILVTGPQAINWTRISLALRQQEVFYIALVLVEYLIVRWSKSVCFGYHWSISTSLYFILMSITLF